MVAGPTGADNPSCRGRNRFISLMPSSDVAGQPGDLHGPGTRQRIVVSARGCAAGAGNTPSRLVSRRGVESEEWRRSGSRGRLKCGATRGIAGTGHERRQRPPGIRRAGGGPEGSRWRDAAMSRVAYPAAAEPALARGGSQRSAGDAGSGESHSIGGVWPGSLALRRRPGSRRSNAAEWLQRVACGGRPQPLDT